jgi:hypothetical protein
MQVQSIKPELDKFDSADFGITRSVNICLDRSRSKISLYAMCQVALAKNLDPFVLTLFFVTFCPNFFFSGIHRLPIKVF